MSDKTGIAWTDATFNPWWGCVKVSPGCDHCYAERDAARFAPGNALWGVGSDRRQFGEKHWNEPVRWNRKAIESGRRLRVFCASMADVFDNHETAEELRPRLWDLIRATPAIDWQILTKRVGNVAARLPADWGHEGYPNVWLGISVVNQEEVDRDIPKLLTVAARVRWLSIEPQLGPVDLHRWLAIDWKCSYCRTFFSGPHKNRCPDCGLEGGWTGSHSFNGRHYPRGPISPSQRGSGLDWIIVGGESGPKARRFDVEWARVITQACKAAGVPCFVKQLGAKPITDHRTRPQGESSLWTQVLRDRAGSDPLEWPFDIRVREFPA